MKFDYTLDFKRTDFRAHPELYRVGRGEQGVLLVEPYKGEIPPYWRFKTLASARGANTCRWVGRARFGTPTTAAAESTSARSHRTARVAAVRTSDPSRRESPIRKSSRARRYSGSGSTPCWAIPPTTPFTKTTSGVRRHRRVL